MDARLVVESRVILLPADGMLTLLAGEQRLIRPSVTVGDGRRTQSPLVGDRKEANGHTGGWRTVRRVQNVCRQAPHLSPSQSLNTHYTCLR